MSAEQMLLQMRLFSRHYLIEMEGKNEEINHKKSL